MFGLLLGPFMDRLMELERHVEDLQRRTDSMIRVGVCKSVEPETGLCVVEHGELRTPQIRYMHPSAGEQSEARHPSIGEQCVLLNFGAGENGTLYVALFGLPTTLYPMASTKAEVTKRVYKDGAASSYDHAKHALGWLNGQVSLEATNEAVELKIGTGGVRAGLESIEIYLGDVGLMIDAEGAHFTGPLVDREGQIISGE